jgi:hypothetical protein
MEHETRGLTPVKRLKSLFSTRETETGRRAERLVLFASYELGICEVESELRCAIVFDWSLWRHHRTAGIR